MRIHPCTLLLSGMAAGALGAGIALAPNASAEEPTCHHQNDGAMTCETPGNYEGTFPGPTNAPQQLPFPLV